jgi:hypothetical protein
MKLLYKTFTTWWALVCFAGSLCLPTSNAFANSCQSGTDDSSCAVVSVGGEQVSYPIDTWTTIGTYDGGDVPGFSSLLEGGSQSKVSLNQAAAQYGLTSSQIANIVKTLPSQSIIVFGRVSPLSGLMDVTAIRLIRQGTKVTLSTSKFSPYDGYRWAAARTYMSPSEKLSQAGPGPSPFKSYEGGDDEFHNIPQAGITQAETILGVAARYYKAQIAYLNVANFALQQWVTTSHHLFTTTTTEHTAGNETPEWYVGLPPGMANSTGNAGASICLEGVDTCSAPEHVVPSGLVWNDWSTGNLPGGTKTIHEFDVSHTGLNIIVIAAIIAVVSFGAFTAVAAAMAAGGTAISTAGVMANLATTLLSAAGVTAAPLATTAAVGAAIDGLTYVAAAAAVQGAGPFSADNLVLSAPPTTSGAFQPQTADETYFQSIEGQAMTAPVGNMANQVDKTGNNGFQAFSNFDQGYNTNAEPTANTNLQFNSMQYIRDTQ